MALVTKDLVSFRHILLGAVREFVRDEAFEHDDVAEALAEIVVQLASYREEGELLHPVVFLCDDRAAMLSRLGARDVLAIGRGPRDDETIRKALKQCAPLGRGGWSIYVVRREQTFEYGLFRSDSFFLEPTPMARLRALVDSDVRILGVVQLADSILELRGSRGHRRLVYLSGVRSDALPAIALLKDLVTMAIHHVPNTLRTRTRVFFERVFIDAMRAPHGSLIAVLPAGAAPSEQFADAIVLERPIRVPELIAAYERAPSDATRSTIEGAGHLLEGMLRADGITVLASDGSIVAYNAFVSLGGGSRGSLGGARRRTFDALAATVGTTLVGAFLKSQDGAAECCTARSDSTLLLAR